MNWNYKPEGRGGDQIAEGLKGYTRKCVISFVDTYTKNSKVFQEIGVLQKTREELNLFASKLKEIADRNGMVLAIYDSVSVKNCLKLYDPASPLLCGEFHEGDKIIERKVKSLKEIQLELWDLV